MCCTGSATRNRQLLSPLRALGPDVDTIGPMSYRELQRASDEGFPPGQQHYWKSGYISELGDDLIDVMLERVTEMPSLTSGVGLQQLRGAASRMAPSATAFAHRGDRYDCLILSQWPDPARSRPRTSPGPAVCSTRSGPTRPASTSTTWALTTATGSGSPTVSTTTVLRSSSGSTTRRTSSAATRTSHLARVCSE